MCRKGRNMEKDTKTRKWLITINNPQDKGYSHEHIRDIMKRFTGCVYWCMADEIGGERQTYHTHIYMCCKSAVRFSTVQSRFPKANLDMCKGTSSENRDYVFKLGKWEKSAKAETKVADTQEEYGEMPIERQGARNDLADMYDMIKQGMDDVDILEQSPDYILHFDKIDKVRQALTFKKFKNVEREVQCSYIWGLTGTGKTSSIVRKYGYDNVYRVTDYKHPFDGYRGQDVLVFEEFRSDLPMKQMLQFLDRYPLELPARFYNRYACYTKVYLISNEPLSYQYPNMQHDEPRGFNAFLRRIKNVYYFDGNGIKHSTIEVDDKGFRTLLQGEYNAFSEVVE